MNNSIMEKVSNFDLFHCVNREGFIFTSITDPVNVFDAIVVRNPEYSKAWSPKKAVSNHTLNEHIEIINMLKLLKKSLCILCVCILSCLTGCDISNIEGDESTGVEINNKVPLEYAPILSKYEIMIDGILSNDFESEFNSNSEKFSSPDPNFEYEWSSMVIDATKAVENPSRSSFGYIIKDIDLNGIDELFLVSKDYKILAVFTLYDNKPKLLGAYWSRNKCILLDSGDLYILSSSGAQYFEYSIQRISKDGQKLEKVKRFGCEGDNYYESINSEIIKIDNVRFEELLSIYPYKSEENNVLTGETILN